MIIRYETAHQTNITIITASKKLDKDKIAITIIEEEIGRETLWTVSSRIF